MLNANVNNVMLCTVRIIKLKVADCPKYSVTKLTILDSIHGKSAFLWDFAISRLICIKNCSLPDGNIIQFGDGLWLTGSLL